MKNLYFNNLKEKIKNKKFTVGIVGLGYVGLPLANAFVKNNINVYGFDNDNKKINIINSGKSYINYFKDHDIKLMLKNKFKCFSSLENIKKVDVIILCLPTPLNKNKTPNMKYIKTSMRQIKKYLIKGQAISLESTTYPGTTREVIAVELKDFDVGKDFFLIYSPEREDPGNKKYSISKTPKVVGGFSINCLNIAYLIYKILVKKVIKVSSLEVAEFTKLLENIYRSVNIGMINEMKLLTTKMKINIFEVIKAAKTKPFGFQAFYPGPGYGGHCIPIDPFLLSWRAEKYNFDTKFIKLSGKINENMPKVILKKICLITKKNKNKKILILGAAYKKNVDDIRESPSLKIMKLLDKRGIKFDYYDPYVDEILGSRNYKKYIKSISFINKKLNNYDATVLVTDHDNLDYKKILKYSKLIIDTRGRYAFYDSSKIIQV